MVIDDPIFPGGKTMTYVNGADGTKLYVEDAGDGAPVVFVSSAWLGTRMWEFQVPAVVAAGHRAVTYDRRGHGRSDRPWDGYDYDTLADDLAAILGELDLSGVTLVSQSMGAGEVVRYLTRHGSARVAGIVLIAPLTPLPMWLPDNPQGIPLEVFEAEDRLRAADRPGWMTASATGFFGDDHPEVSVSDAMRRWMIDQCLDVSARATSQVARAVFTTDFRAELPTVDLPALVLHGERDVQAPIDLCGRRTAELLPDARLRTYPDAAHGLFITHAAALNADLLGFLSRRVAAGAAEGSVRAS
ncbi:alpha/beta fold hydrolase [Amycolatopsis thermophila]|uniref:Pimeloyl-ACP methyl ester carboxylesterase n=1 Tax=Amycolatopsis thermophila TaxID=206084 RepID=A0ABU0EP23_9PSEU|nr:alpha/beta hydrolase [Amycolatopsis thermophila]MDQ0377041.1 pimeloyl-ACP methyl ester carboxylesterase [Amycolatopsis thermophila]